MLVYCGEMVVWIKMKLGMQVGYEPGHIVFDGDPVPPSPKGQRRYLLWPNGWMDQDAIWYEGRPQLKRHCVRWGPAPRSQNRGHSPIFWPMSVVAKRLLFSVTAERLLLF